MLKCKECKKETTMLYKGLCMFCIDENNKDEILNIKHPESVIFVARVTKFAKGRRHVEIPKTQRPLTKLSMDYYVILKPREKVKS